MAGKTGGDDPARPHCRRHARHGGQGPLSGWAHSRGHGDVVSCSGPLATPGRRRRTRPSNTLRGPQHADEHVYKHRPRGGANDRRRHTRRLVARSRVGLNFVVDTSRARHGGPDVDEMKPTRSRACRGRARPSSAPLGAPRPGRPQNGHGGGAAGWHEEGIRPVPTRSPAPARTGDLSGGRIAPRPCRSATTKSRGLGQMTLPVPSGRWCGTASARRDVADLELRSLKTG